MNRKDRRFQESLVRRGLGGNYDSKRIFGINVHER